MSIPELDLKKVNLQAAVGYLISLHDNEVDWNLLGIRVIGAIDSLPIPAGDYEYGDAYMVGTETPYDMYIYTRPDGEVHTEGYWFPIGKFPMPGPQGPKGDGWEQIQSLSDGSVKSLTYSSQSGADITSNASVSYIDSTAGEGKFKYFTMFSKMPIVPGKYISMDATANNKAVKVKVDETALGLDFIKIDKTQNDAIPVAYAGTIRWNSFTSSNVASTIVSRDSAGKSSFNKVLAGTISSTDEKYNTPTSAIYFGIVRTYESIPKTVTDTGTLTAGVLTHLKSHPSLNIQYNNQTYYRMDPTNAPDGTLNYVHLDSVQDGAGGYSMTGKCFSITVSTRAWQVVDLNTRLYEHDILLDDEASGTEIRFSLPFKTNSPFTDPEDLWNAMENKSNRICYVRTGKTTEVGTIDAGMFSNSKVFHVQTAIGKNYTVNQLTISDEVY